MPISRSVLQRSLLGAIALAVSMAVMAGCTGSQNQLSPAAPQTSAQSTQDSLITPDSCRHVGGVRVTPCKVEFTASNPGPDTVTLKTPNGSKGSVVEHDSCAASGIATVTQASDNTWTVTAGATAGTCRARFNYFNNGQKVGFAVLTVVNDL